MLGKKKRAQPTLFIPGSIEDFIPDDHILKRVDRVLDLGWLRGEAASLYCENNGRPSIDPEAAVRLMLAGFFHGIVHDRKLMREAQVNLAMRWFAGYALDEALPDHSSLTRIRQRWGQEMFRRIFARTVADCAAAGLVSGETVHVDATLIRADVSWESLTEQWAETTIRENSEGPANGRDDDAAANNGGGSKISRTKKQKRRSTTDPDATMVTSQHTKPLEPSYKQHTSVDDRAGVIVDVDVTTGEASEGELLLETVERIEKTLAKKIDAVTADAGYAHPENYRKLEERKTKAVIPPQKSRRIGKTFPMSRFKYDETHNYVKCPAGKKLKKNSRVRNGYAFRGEAKFCGVCPLRKACVPPSVKVRTILIVDGYAALTRARRRHGRLDEAAREQYRRHRWRVEGAHGEAKTQHGLRRAARRGIAEVAIQVFLTAAAINLKRLAGRLLRVIALLNAQTGAPSAFSPPICANIKTGR